MNGYMRQLDGVRASAAIVVLVSHLVPSGPWHNFDHWGYYAVRLFFVLSGFLITGILLDVRDRLPRDQVGCGIWGFYSRRALRIFPIYYLCVMVIMIISHDRVSENIAYGFYVANWYLAGTGLADPMANHFWSLAVEEQFYLAWPWLILLLPNRALLPTIVAVVLVGPTSRFLLVCLGYSSGLISFNTLSCLDSLGAGAALAYVRTRFGPAAGARLARWALLASVPLLVVAPPLPGWWRTHYVPWYTFRDLAMAGPFLWLVRAAADGATGPLGRVLGASPVVYLGRISYGIYVYHEFMPRVVPWACRGLGVPLPGPGYARAAILVGISVGVAALSWHMIEAPINSLKRFFPYGRRAPSRFVEVVA